MTKKYAEELIVSMTVLQKARTIDFMRAVKILNEHIIATTTSKHTEVWPLDD